MKTRAAPDTVRELRAAGVPTRLAKAAAVHLGQLGEIIVEGRTIIVHTTLRKAQSGL